MKTSVIVFPGSNCDRDVAVCLKAASGRAAAMVWHRETSLPESDLIVLPGGFSYGDYLRPGGLAAHSPVMRSVVAAAKRGVPVLGICNGFQMLTESGLLPGVLMRNATLTFVCRPVRLRVERRAAPFTEGYESGQVITLPAAHHDGNFVADAATLDRLEGEGRVAFRYDNDNPNGSMRDIAGIVNESGTVLGLMPHPERHADPLLGGTDGVAFFSGLVAAHAGGRP